MMEQHELPRKSKLSIGDVTAAHVSAVYQCMVTLRDGEMFTKKAAAVAQAKALPDAARWLLSFTGWAIGSRTMPRLNQHDYIMLPCSPTPVSTFQDFVRILKRYRSTKVTRKNEKEMIAFLVGCTEEHREYYFSLMDKEYLAYDFARNTDMRELFGKHEITPEEIYGKVTLLSDGFKQITYPLVLTAMPRDDLPPALIYRTAKDQYFRIVILEPKNLAQVTFTKKRIKYTWLKDRKYIHSNEFILLGRIDVEGGKFYAMDYFPSFNEYYRHRKGKAKLPHTDRLKLLEEFMLHNFTLQIISPPKVPCIAAYELEAKISELLQQTEHNYVMVMDGRNRVYGVHTIEKQGLVGGLWTDAGIVRGLNVWNCGEVVPCGYSFPGNTKALLYTPEFAFKKPCKFSWFTFEEYSVGAVREIYWDKKPYRKYRFTYPNGLDGLVEKCPICLRDNIPVETGVLCKACYIRMLGQIENMGPDVWIPVSGPILTRRKKGDWSADWINKCGISFKGLWVICDPKTGHLKLSQNQMFRERYEKILAHIGMDLNKIKDWQRELRRKELEHERGSDQTEIVCGSSEFYQPDPVAEVGVSGDPHRGKGDDQTDIEWKD